MKITLHLRTVLRVMLVNKKKRLKSLGMIGSSSLNFLLQTVKEYYMNFPSLKIWYEDYLISTQGF